ncbi:hypothetical protein [Andreprevotia lacus]|jgi:hypothetical protein|uniref:hypothetical protein n=1 Tax=Andreprevotia lacus TaxID=1121000 RepID=UPI0009FF5CB7|nr:hypothetical protein [Andreprevotia lacus]
MKRAKGWFARRAYCATNRRQRLHGVARRPATFCFALLWCECGQVVRNCGALCAVASWLLRIAIAVALAENRRQQIIN